MVNRHVFKTTLNINTPLIKMIQEDNTLNEENMGVLLISSVSPSPLYLILLLISYLRPILKRGSVRSVSKPIPTRANGKRPTQTEKPTT